MQPFEEKVKEMINKKGISISRLAKESGYSIPYISDLLKGNRRWNEDNMERVGRVVGLEIYFVEKTGTEGR